MAGHIPQTSNNRKRAGSSRSSLNRESYIDGTSVKRLKPREEPQRRQQRQLSAPQTRTQRQQPRQRASAPRHTNVQVSSETRKNREKATIMNSGFVIFLAIICVAIFCSAVYYLEVRSDLTTAMEQVAAAESTYSQLKENNDALNNQVMSSVDLAEIKKEALGRLGMTYPSEEQTETYETSRSSYVRQYQEVPGVE
ncbi:MAG: hypothetical protein Q4E89_09830 [Eubacteriales bacterium]|nr:hypothetical protein [Eubacteriales bacterium]